MVLIENVSFKYSGSDKYSLQNINLKLDKGDCLLLTGPSGCGKSTITKLINGLIPSYFEGELTGKVFIEGTDVSEIPMYELSKKVASVFQNPKTQFFNIDAEDEIVFSLENQGVSNEIIWKRLEEAKEKLGLEKLIGKRLFEMSGGEKQIIAFASAYVSDAKIVVLDEPSANLDLDHIRIIKDIMKKLMEQGKVIVIAEHRLAYLKEMVTKVCYLRDGKILHYYTGKEFYDMPDTERRKLGLRELTSTALNNLVLTEKISKVPELLTKAEEGVCIKNLRLKYDAWNGKEINLSFQYGEVVGVVGHNGFGKTTFIRTLCGLLKEKSGDICVDGKKLTRSKRRKLYGMVMQDVNYQLFSRSVMEECRLGNGEVSKGKICELLENLALADKVRVHPISLSGGEKQRLSIAVMLIGGKKILLLDEPTSGLDYENMMRISSILKDVAKQGVLCIVVTHDVEFINQVCSRVIGV